jgi:hypothetical protein
MIQAINSMTSISSQPIKPINFASRKPAEQFMREQTFGTQGDSFATPNPRVLQQELDLACRLAAYYKQEYEKLAENGECLA